ncbi:MAG TPA: MOSC domain-containing protein [Terriglobales bacterium]|nr:MOSC domain-containing protein [Terriglobales bacterium]
MPTPVDPKVVAVHRAAKHQLSKETVRSIELLAGLGVAGDAHRGTTVQHRSRVARDPQQPNLRQVHLVHVELFDQLIERGLVLTPGIIGENITTRGIALLALPRGSRLHLGESAVVEITGLRNPCIQLDALHPGLMSALIERRRDGSTVRKAGVMAVVLTGGVVAAGDRIRVELPAQPHAALEPV